MKSDTGTSLEAAFMHHVHPEPNSGCWLWIGPIFALRGGYGCFTMRPLGIVQMRAHRMSWSMFCGEVPKGSHVLHKCDNPACVNPDHLFIGDQPTNMVDKVRKRRQDKGATHGMHKLTEAEAIQIISDPRPYAQIAADFNISVPTVSDIKRGRSWKHLRGAARRYKRAA